MLYDSVLSGFRGQRTTTTRLAKPDYREQRPDLLGRQQNNLLQSETHQRDSRWRILSSDENHLCIALPAQTRVAGHWTLGNTKGSESHSDYVLKNPLTTQFSVSDHRLICKGEVRPSKTTVYCTWLSATCAKFPSCAELEILNYSNIWNRGIVACTRIYEDTVE